MQVNDERRSCFIESRPAGGRRGIVRRPAGAAALVSVLWLSFAGSTADAEKLESRSAAPTPAAKSQGRASGPVRISEDKMVIPTYQLGPPEPNPLFYTQESYQGAQKRIYPYPFQDFLTHVKEDQAYKALNLENDYIKLTVLPELGGRLFAATDKSNNYDFFYRQHVIKPALIGMLGAWISGGVEWCAFHHHRNTTYMPVDYALTDNPDGGKTIWIGETERRHRMKWLLGITLRPDKSYVEVSGTFFNRTPLPHSILYWGNVAVHVNDDYQIIFPPSVDVATFHSKVDFSYWPVGKGKYRGTDYTGVDMTWWKNHPEPTSFFTWNLQEDFMGGYDHSRQAGTVHVGNHHIVCAAKLWEWGTGPFGRMWDRILTDEDGPYAELMVGAFSDNQPDYSWVKPYEVKTFKQYWYPIRGLGGFKNANLNGAINLELKPDNLALVGFHATSERTGARVVLERGKTVLFETTADIGPARPFTREVAVPADVKLTELRVAVRSPDGRELISYQPRERQAPSELPRAVKPPPPPKEIKTVEELYLTGLRIEQIHNPSVDPSAYYGEALRRDPGDSRSNTILGIHYLRRGLYESAEKHLRSAIERVSAEYTRPGNAEAYYQLGLALRAQGKVDEAYENFYRAAWDYAFHSAAYYQLAELSFRKGDFAQALEQVEHALATNVQNTKLLDLKAAVLRKLGRLADSHAVISTVLAADPLDFLALNELHLCAQERRERGEADATLAALTRKMRDEVQSYLELAVDYLNWGRLEEATEVLLRPVRSKMGFASTYPLVYYYLGYLAEQRGRPKEATEYFAQGAKMPPDYCFPFRLETVPVLEAALRSDPSDARALYYLGNLLFEIQPERAMECWGKSKELDDRFATVHRNLGWGHYRFRNDIAKAISGYEEAIACDNRDPRLLLELDALYEFGNVAPERRLAALEKNHETVLKRKETLIREIAVLVLCGKYDKAIDYLAGNFFHVREGGGEIHDIYVDAHLLKGLQCLATKQSAEALGHFRKASEYPENLSVGRPKRDRRAPQVEYYIGVALEALGDGAAARQSFQLAADQADTGEWPETQFYQALCWEKLGVKEKATAVFDRLIELGRRGVEQGEPADFFAKFGEQETRQARRASAHYALGLGLLGKGDPEQAKQQFEQAVRLNVGHVWALQQLSQF